MLLLAKLVLHVGQNSHEGGGVDHLVSQYLRVSIQQPNLFTVRQGYTLITVRVNTAGINAIGSKALVISHKLVITTRDNPITLSNYVLDGLSKSQRLRTRYLALHAIHQSLNGTTVKNRDTGFMRDSKGHIRTTFGNVCIVICHSSSSRQLSQFFLIELGQLVGNLMWFTHQFDLISHQIRRTSSSHLVHTQVYLLQYIVACLDHQGIFTSSSSSTFHVVDQHVTSKGIGFFHGKPKTKQCLTNLEFHIGRHVGVDIQFPIQLSQEGIEGLRNFLHRVTRDGIEGSLVSSYRTLFDEVQWVVNPIKDEQSTFSIGRVCGNKLNCHTITGTNDHSGNAFYPWVNWGVYGRQGTDLTVERLTIRSCIIKVGPLTSGNKVVLSTSIDLRMQRIQGFKNLLLLFGRQVATTYRGFRTVLGHQLVHTLLVGISQDDPLNLCKGAKRVYSNTYSMSDCGLDSRVHRRNNKVSHVVRQNLKRITTYSVLRGDTDLLWNGILHREGVIPSLLRNHSTVASQGFHSLIQQCQFLICLGVITEHCLSSSQRRILRPSQQSIGDTCVQVIKHGISQVIRNALFTRTIIGDGRGVLRQTTIDANDVSISI